MKKMFFLLCVLSFGVSAQTKYPLGDGLEKWGVPLRLPESELALRLGARFQSLATFQTEENLATDQSTSSQDFQARRVRFQFQAELGKRALYYMDIRNDNANQNDKGEQTFNIGDAYVQIPLQNNAHTSALRLFRAKIDVARTQTVSSSELIFLNRSYVADDAANFVSHNRRASNVQVIGNYLKKVSYQFAIGDGVYSKKFSDARGSLPSGAGASIERQNFMLGGKLRFHPFSGWEENKLTETYLGEGKHFTVGAGLFNTSNINFVSGGNSETISRNLINVEASAHYGEWNFISEYFKLDGVVEDLNSPSFKVGYGEGAYVMGEKLFSNFHYLAPFVRYEKWNRFVESGDYESDSQLYGINWYLNGNRFRVSAAYQVDQLGQDIEGDATRIESVHLASMWLF